MWYGQALNFLKTKRVHSDNYVFRLFYRATVGLHLAFVGLLGWGQYFGSPITCSGDSLIEAYCWIQGLWTIRQKESVFDPGSSVQPHPGVGIYRQQQHDKVYHRFYQWVPTVLLFFAMIFYMPRYIWKKLEGNRMVHICNNMQDQALNDEEESSRVKRLVSFYKRPKLNRNNLYVISLVVCELLNCVAVFAVWKVTDALLSGRFDEYGRYLLTYLRYGMITDGPEGVAAWGVNPMDSLFPKMAKCDFHKIGASGTKEKVDIMCVLPLNVVNEKVFYFLWLWYILLGLLSVANIAYRILTYFSFAARRAVLLGNLQGINIGTCPKKDRKILYKVVDKLTRYGDWYVLTRIKRNVDIGTFSQFIRELAIEIEIKAIEMKVREEGNEDKERDPRGEHRDIDEETEPEPPVTRIKARMAPVLKDRGTNIDRAKAMGHGMAEAVKKVLTPVCTPRNSPILNRKAARVQPHHPPPAVAGAAAVAAAAAGINVNAPPKNGPKTQDKANQQAYKKNNQRGPAKGEASKNKDEENNNGGAFTNKAFTNNDEDTMKNPTPEETTINIEAGDIEMNESKLVDMDDQTPIMPTP